MARKFYNINTLKYDRFIKRQDVKDLSSSDDVGFDVFILTKRSDLLEKLLTEWGYDPSEHPMVCRILVDLGIWKSFTLIVDNI